MTTPTPDTTVHIRDNGRLYHLDAACPVDDMAYSRTAHAVRYDEMGRRVPCQVCARQEA